MKGHEKPEAPPAWIVEALAGLPPLLTVTEATNVLRMSRRNFFRLLSLGKISTIRTGANSSKHLIARGELERYLRSLEAGCAA